MNVEAERPIYLDWAATAPLRSEARAALVEVLAQQLGNPSSLHGPGRAARQLLTRARRAIGEALGASRDAVLFTGNGSEANLLAIVGACRALPAERRHVLTSPLEHPCVLAPLEALAKAGEIELELLPVDNDGRVDPAAVAARRRPATGLVALQLANHEIGTLEPVAEVARLVRPHGVLVHTDATQAVGKTPVHFADLDVDLLAASPHKFGGPRGIGILVRRDGVTLASPLSSGRQEQGLRGGTEDVAAVVASAAALTAALAELARTSAHLTALSALLVAQLEHRFADVSLHSPRAYALPGLVNFSFSGIDGAWLVAALDRRGVALSHGAACSSLAALPSPVLVALGAGVRARGAIRVSMGATTTHDDLENFVARLADVVVEIRSAQVFFTSQNRGNSR